MKEDLEKTLNAAAKKRVREIMLILDLENTKPTHEQLINLLALQYIGEAAGKTINQFCDELMKENKEWREKMN